MIQWEERSLRMPGSLYARGPTVTKLDSLACTWVGSMQTKKGETRWLVCVGTQSVRNKRTISMSNFTA